MASLKMGIEIFPIISGLIPFFIFFKFLLVFMTVLEFILEFRVLVVL